MEPTDLPILAGGSVVGGGEQPPPTSVSDLESSALTDLADAESALASVLDSIEAEATADIEADELENDSGWWEYARESLDDLAAGESRIQPLLDEVFAAASEDLDASHRAIESIGGRPFLMTDESWGANQADSHFADAMDRIIFPAIAQQEREASEPTDATVTPPPMDGPDEPAPPREPPIPIPGIQFPAPGEPAPPEPLPVPAPDPGGEPPAPSPPTSPPVTPTEPGGVCCPNPDPPVVNVVVNVPPFPATVYPPPAPYPPVSPVPPGTPVAPGIPQPTIPEPPPVPKNAGTPPPTFPGNNYPVDLAPILSPAIGGTFDGPKFCELVADCRPPGEAATNSQGISRIVGDFAGIIVSAIPFLNNAGGPVRDAITGFINKIFESSGVLAAQKGIADPRCVGTVISSTAVLKLVQQYTGIDFSYSIEPQMQAMRYSSPVLIPSQSNIDTAYLRNVLSFKDWECYTRANGNLPYIHSKVMEAGRTTNSISEAAQLRRRRLMTEQQYYDVCRINGVLESEVMQRIYALSEYIPTTTDIFSWMVKDVANERYVQIAKLDEDFAESWSDAFQYWADANGITKQQIQYQYRAQWKLPSKTQVDEFIRRLRPGRVDPSVAFTIEDAKLLYKLDEIPAGFRDRLIQTSYIPINRTDIMAAYVAGSMPLPEVNERFQDIGYSPADAAALTDFVKVKAEQQVQGSMGAWTRRRITTEYVAGSIDRDKAETLMSRTVKDANRVQDALNDADTIRSALARKQCIKALKKRFMNGEFDTMGVRVELLNLGLNVTVAQTLIEGWACERNSKHKEPTVAMLSDWAKKGLITVPQFRDRLLNLGYSGEDSDRIVRMTDIEEREKQLKEAEKRAEKAKKDAEKRAKQKK